MWSLFLKGMERFGAVRLGSERTGVDWSQVLVLLTPGVLNNPEGCATHGNGSDWNASGSSGLDWIGAEAGLGGS